MLFHSKNQKRIKTIFAAASLLVIAGMILLYLPFLFQ
jgi:hypothetical protein